MRRLLLIFALVAAVLLSCDKGNVLIIEGFVFNAKTNEALQGVKVTLKTSSEKETLSASTDGNGFFSLEEVLIGDYILVLELDSFLERRVSVGLGNSTGNQYILSDGVSKQTITINSNLQPLTESADITVYKVFQGYQVVAAGVDYTIYFGQGIEPVSGTTDSKGIMSLTSMPYGGSVNVIIEFASNGVTYEYDNNIGFPVGTNSNSITIVGEIIESDLGIVSSNVLDARGEGVEDFDIGDDIEVVFTQNVDTANSSVTFSTLAKIEWSNGTKKVTITPDDKLAYESTYVVTINVTSMEGTEGLNTNLVFTTEEE